jgi:hypothetical protein
MMIAAYAASAVRILRGSYRGRPVTDPLYRLMFVLGVLLLLESLYSLTYIRVFGVAMPAVVLAGSELAALGTRARRVATGCGVLVVLIAGVQQIAFQYKHNESLICLPGGCARTERPRAEKLEWLASRIRPGERLFVAEGGPGYYLPLGLQNSVFLDGVRSAPCELLSRTQADLDRNHIEWVMDVRDPHVEASASPIRSFREYLTTKYALTKLFPDGVAVWRRMREP